MGNYFSDVVDKAIADLYYCYDRDKAQAAVERLLPAAHGGDGDAYYLLSRCFSGTYYGWEYHPFQENQASAYAMLREAIALGSAMAVLGALRMDMLTPAFRELMPFASVKEAWEVVYEKAAAGCQLCQYMIGNTYYFLDIIEIEDRKEREFESKTAWDDWCREQIKQCLPWFEQAFFGGMGLAGRNYRDYYGDGRGDLIAPDDEKKLAILHQGAEMGYPDWMYYLAAELYYDLDKAEEALPWALQAAQAGHLYGWGIVADIYWEGKVVEQDLPYALACYEKTANYGNDNYACRRLGEMYFRGLGTPKDYARAIQYLERDSNGNYKRYDLLGICYLLGYGCEQDVARGKALLEKSADTRYKNYGLGMMYAEGIGVAENIEKGVGYLKAAGHYEPAMEALKNYKKSFFGVWRRK